MVMIVRGPLFFSGENERMSDLPFFSSEVHDETFGERMMHSSFENHTLDFEGTRRSCCGAPFINSLFKVGKRGERKNRKNHDQRGKKDIFHVKSDTEFHFLSQH